MSKKVENILVIILAIFLLLISYFTTIDYLNEICNRCYVSINDATIDDYSIVEYPSRGKSAGKVKINVSFKYSNKTQYATIECPFETVMGIDKDGKPTTEKTIDLLYNPESNITKIEFITKVRLKILSGVISIICTIILLIVFKLFILNLDGVFRGYCTLKIQHKTNKC